ARRTKSPDVPPGPAAMVGYSLNAGRPARGGGEVAHGVLLHGCGVGLALRRRDPTPGFVLIPPAGIAGATRVDAELLKQFGWRWFWQSLDLLSVEVDGFMLRASRKRAPGARAGARQSRRPPAASNRTPRCGRRATGRGGTPVRRACRVHPLRWHSAGPTRPSRRCSGRRSWIAWHHRRPRRLEAP